MQQFWIVLLFQYVFVRGTVLLSGGLNVSIGNCVIVPVHVFVSGTVMLSSWLNVSVVDWLVDVSVDVYVGGGVAVHLSPSFCWRKSSNCFCTWRFSSTLR